MDNYQSEKSCVCVCNQEAYVHNFTDAADRLLIHYEGGGVK